MTRRSALGHSLVTPLNVWKNDLLEVPDFSIFSVRFELLLDFFGGEYSIQLSYGALTYILPIFTALGL